MVVELPQVAFLSCVKVETMMAKKKLEMTRLTSSVWGTEEEEGGQYGSECQRTWRIEGLRVRRESGP